MKTKRSFEGRKPLALMLRGFTIASFAAVSILVSAQDSSSNDVEVYELSPFTVDSSADSGYRATSTLAGSRINTRLDDIAASISVVTKEFMEDVAATDAQELFTYTTGTEAAGIKGNYSGMGGEGSSFVSAETIMRSPTTKVRIRGLDDADLTRDFFQSAIPWDTYNIDRVEINRGANSFLYGLGSPAGIVNINTIRPNVQRRTGSFEFELDDHGSNRVVVDFNEPLIEGSLAIRGAVKVGDDRYDQEEAYKRDERVFLTTEFKATETTTLRANYENGHFDAHHPDQRPPNDHITHWVDMGKTVYNPITDTYTNTGPVSPGHLSGEDNPDLFNGTGNRPYFFTSSSQGWANNINGAGGISGVVFRNPDVLGGRLRTVTHGHDYARKLAASKNLPGSGSFTNPVISDPSIFNFFEHNMVGPNKLYSARWETYNVTLEQRFPQINAAFEFTFDEQHFDQGFEEAINWRTNGISIDINTHMLDGVPNPNLGRPVIASDHWSSGGSDVRRTKRFTGYWELKMSELLDGEKLSRIFGDHRFTVSATEHVRNGRNNGGRPYVTDPGYWHAFPSAAASGDKKPNGGYRGFQTWAYIGDSLLDGDFSGANLQPLTVNLTNQDRLPISFYNTETASWDVYETQIIRGEKFNKEPITTDWAYRSTREEVESQSLAIQSSFWDGAIVSTVGWREDDIINWRSPSSQLVNFNFTEVPINFASPSLDTPPASNFSWGVVARPPTGIGDEWALKPSVFYNTSDNTRVGSSRVAIDGTTLDPPSGSTQDYGFSLSTADEKLHLRMAFFETSSNGRLIDTRAVTNGLVRGTRRAVENIISGEVPDGPQTQPFLSWITSPAASFFTDPFEFMVTLDGQGRPTSVSVDEKHGVLYATSDVVSEGHEAELVYNPTSNWRLALNFSHQKAVTSNSFTRHRPFLESIEAVMLGPIGDLQVNSGGNSPWRDELITYSTSVRKNIAQDGFPTPELRQNRLNLLTNYTFNEGRFKGFNVGGSVRWQDSVALGHRFVVDPELGELPDLNQPFEGPKETNYDLWVGYRRKIMNDKYDWKVQLNVKNLGVGNELIPSHAQPDGTIAVYRITMPQTIALTNRISF